MQQQISFLDSQYGKMFPELSVQTEEKTSERSSKPSVQSEINSYMCLDLRKGYGNLLGAYWATGSVLHGGYTMHKGGEFRSDAVESTLSQILDLKAPEKYYLSPKACSGILKRAHRRGKKLPRMLQEALEEVAGPCGGLEMIPENPDDQEEMEECIDEEDE